MLIFLYHPVECRQPLNVSNHLVQGGLSLAEPESAGGAGPSLDLWEWGGAACLFEDVALSAPFVRVIPSTAARRGSAGLQRYFPTALACSQSRRSKLMS